MSVKLESGSTSSNSFKLDGLEYQRGIYEPIYAGKESDGSGGIDTTNVRIGLRHTNTREILQSPLPYSSWVDATDTPYASLDALIQDLSSKVFKTASGGSGATSSTSNSQLISGGYFLVENYDYFVWYDDVIINGNQLTIYNSDTVTLSAADGSNDRFDTIVINSDGSISVEEGTPATNPELPFIDTNTQIAVVTIRVTATSTTQAGVTTTTIYDEDIEWTTTNSANVTTDNTEQTTSGTKSIKFNGAANNNFVTLTGGTARDGNDFSSIKLDIYLPSTANYRYLLRFTSEDDATNVEFTLEDGLYGFRTNTTGSWQTIVIPKEAFPGIAGITYNEFSIINQRNNTTAWFDDINIQEGTQIVATEHPDYTINSNGGNLELLKDGEVHSVVPFSGGSITSDTGTTITFTEDTLYNEVTPLTSGNLTLDLTGAVKGVVSVVYCDGYFPSISGEDFKIVVDDRNTSTLNELWFWYDGTRINLSIVSTTQLSAPTLILTPEDLGMGIDWNTIVNADNYVVERSTDNFATAGTQIYSGSLLTYTDSGLTNGTTYYYRIKAQGAGYDESEWSTVASAIPVEFNYALNLVAAYQFESDFTDYLGNHNATPFNITYTTGKVGNCGVFNGTTTKGEVTDDSDFSFTDGSGTDTAFTIAFWVNWDSLSGVQFIIEKLANSSTAEWYIFSNGTDLICHLCSGGNQNIWIRNQIPMSSFTISTWHRVVVTYDGSGTAAGITFYLDGSVQSDTLTSNGTYAGMSNTSADVHIGVSYSDTNRFGGDLDELYIYKGLEWTASQVADDYTQQNAGTATLP